MNFLFKNAKKKDVDFLYNLRNNTSIKKNSINNQRKITKTEHKEWFKKIYNKSLVLIVYLNKIKIGAVRYDKNDVNYLVSIALKPNFHNKGYGGQVLKQSERFIKKNTILIAKIKKTNIKSLKIFLKNSYTILKKNKLIILYKIFKTNSKNQKYNSIISKIELIRKKNNVNWMDVLKLCFQLDPEKTKLIFKRINVDDKKINNLSKKILL
jgi:hypothetical protein